ncbi:MAG: hypothetical protein SNJ64_02850, partial [Endomicrobiia bacterium]
MTPSWKHRQTVPGTNNWSGDNFANSIEGAPRWVKVVASPKEDRKIMATLDNTGKVFTQVWDGSSWISTETVTTAIDADNARDWYRGFDIAYERNSGDAIIVYSNNSSVPRYRVRGPGGSSQWSSEGAVPNWPGTGTIWWVRLEARPAESSNEIILVAQDA